MRGPRGFTLLELLMVVIIIGILASIALPQYLRTAERARAAEALQNLAAIRSAELRFRTQDPAGNYTAVLTKLDIDVPGFGVNPVSPNWKFECPLCSGIGSNATAERTGGGAVNGAKINIDLDGGATCATIDVWGLPTAAC